SPSPADTVPTRIGPPASTTAEASTVPVWVAPMSCCHLLTAVAVADVYLSSTVKPVYPRAARFCSTSVTSGPDSPGCRVRYSGRAPYHSCTGTLSARHTGCPRWTVLPAAGSQVTVPWAWLCTVLGAPYPRVPLTCAVCVSVCRVT